MSQSGSSLFQARRQPCPSLDQTHSLEIRFQYWYERIILTRNETARYETNYPFNTYVNTAIHRVIREYVRHRGCQDPEVALPSWINDSEVDQR